MKLPAAMALCAAVMLCAGVARANDRVSTGVLAISQNPANRLAPVAAPGEEFTSFTLQPGVRVTLQRPTDAPSSRPPHLVLYLLPNGNTTEQAEGRTSATGVDWHYNIQHIAAQTRRVRELLTTQTVITAVVEADTLSWPAWRKATPNPDARIGELVEEIRQKAGLSTAPLDLVAHSGGGGFVFGYINSVEAIPDAVEHIVFLDANYNYDDADGHGRKLQDWLRRSLRHELIVLAYDDRKVRINGKPIVSDTGGTWRATDRMTSGLAELGPLTGTHMNALETSSGLGGRLIFARHPNPDAKILHTVLVEKNGFVYGVAHGRAPLGLQDLPHADDEAYRRWVLP